MFCAVRGRRADGHDHALQAVARGASSLLVEEWIDTPCPQLRVRSVRQAMGQAAAVVHDHPSRALAVAGVTGTNGKTTVSYLLEAAFGADGLGTGLIGTVETRVHGLATRGVLTTPEGTDLQRILADMRRRGVEAVAMEVSSHGLDMHRVDGTRFACAVFTNLSQDHLDWHGTIDAYFEAKSRLFSSELTDRGVVWLDDPWGQRLLDRAEIDIVSVGTDRRADVQILEQYSTMSGGKARVRWGGDTFVVETRLAASFNLSNAVLAVVAATVAGADRDAAVAGVAASDGAPGRLERVDAGQSFTVLVDYAHTPDAIERVVECLRSLMSPQGRLILLLGAGGDRDQAKRRPMGRAASQADVVVITSDNPRTEDPAAIMAAINEGVSAGASGADHPRILVIEDRREAIEAALGQARSDDVVVLAGKGHETTQDLGDVVVDFDDRLVARELMASQIAGLR